MNKSRPVPKPQKHKHKPKKRIYPDKKHICAVCGRSGYTEWHHKVFRSQGGGEGDNLIELCRICHTRAHQDNEFRNKL